MINTVLRLIIANLLQYGGSFIVKWLIYLYDMGVDYFKKLKRTNEQKKALDELNTIATSTDPKIDDVGKKYEDAINSGR